ncbi:MAG TPA: methyltransferase [Acidimicrobiales bacterium]|nr:methyltransferase [Acidimicrobiales bacterium]
MSLGSDTLVTDRGVFSGQRVDPGTVELLAANFALPAAGDLLDLGCGYGPIAVTMARRAPAATVWAIDINDRALALTRENARRLGLGNIRAVRPDAVPAEVRLAAIWSNPPIKVGKEPLHQLLATWLDRLLPDGRAYLVVHKHLGGDSLLDWLNGEGYAAAKRASRKGYRLLEVAPR